MFWLRGDGGIKMVENILLIPGEDWGVGVATNTMMERNRPSQRLEGIALNQVLKPSSPRQPIDLERQAMLTRDLIDVLANDKGEMDGFIVVPGTTGQSPTLGHDEQVDLVEYVFNVAVDYCNQKGLAQIPIVGGAGSNCTAETMSLIKGIEKRIGPSTCLVNTGYYNIGNGPQEGIEDHFKYAAQVSRGNIVKYHVITRGCNVADRTILNLADNKRIAGVKEADSDRIEGKSKGMSTKELIKQTEGKLSWVSGEDYKFFELLEMGGKGIISAGATVAPGLFVGLWRAYKAGDMDKALEYQHKINIFSDNCTFVTKNPIGVAYALSSGTRTPVPTLDQADGGIHVEKCNKVLNLFKDELGIDLSKYRR